MSSDGPESMSQILSLTVCVVKVLPSRPTYLWIWFWFLDCQLSLLSSFWLFLKQFLLVWPFFLHIKHLKQSFFRWPTSSYLKQLGPCFPYSLLLICFCCSLLSLLSFITSVTDACWSSSFFHLNFSIISLIMNLRKVFFSSSTTVKLVKLLWQCC